MAIKTYGKKKILAEQTVVDGILYECDICKSEIAKVNVKTHKPTKKGAYYYEVKTACERYMDPYIGHCNIDRVIVCKNCIAKCASDLAKQIGNQQLESLEINMFTIDGY